MNTDNILYNISQKFLHDKSNNIKDLCIAFAYIHFNACSNNKFS